MAKKREGVMIFTSSVNHAEEILRSLPAFISAMVVGDTDLLERDEIIEAFKNKKIKFLVNVSVLTTGFDAPHVDVIAILRPTESVSLYQQIVGRGLRLSPGKNDCLILDYTGQGHNIYSPQIEGERPRKESVAVEVACPKCGILNEFWGVVDEDGNTIEHFGRICSGAFVDQENKNIIKCGYRYRFKRCESCGSEEDIAAKKCSQCSHIIVDNDTKLKDAMSLKDAHVMLVENMMMEKSFDKKGNDRLKITYYDADGEGLKEYFYVNSEEDKKLFYFNFLRMHKRLPEKELSILNIEDAINKFPLFRVPQYIIARKDKYFWKIREKIFKD
jgi:DNA repair protein RadD